MNKKNFLPKKNYLPPFLRKVKCIHDLSMMASSASSSLEDFEEETVISD